MNVPYQALENFCNSTLVAAGFDHQEASVISKSLAWCDAAGLSTHGVWRLPVLLENFASGGVKSPCNYQVSQSKPSCLSIDGNNGMGHYLCSEAVDLGVEASKKQGLCSVRISNSNFCGGLSYYMYKAAENKCAALIFSNSYPKVAAHGGTEAVLGTNPLAFGAPGKNGGHFILDMSTASSAGSTVAKAARVGNTIPEGIAVSKSGNSIVDPNLVQHGALLPFGGAKGFGLSLVVEILAGILSGAKVSKELTSLYKHPESPGGNGQFLVIFNIESFMESEAFLNRLETLKLMLKGDEKNKVRIPGEKKMELLSKSLSEGVFLDEDTSKILQEISTSYRVSLP